VIILNLGFVALLRDIEVARNRLGGAQCCIDERHSAAFWNPGAPAVFWGGGLPIRDTAGYQPALHKIVL
jgi:hypothetical protein